LPEGVYTYEMQKFYDRLIAISKISGKEIFLMEALRVWQQDISFHEEETAIRPLRKVETVTTIGGYTIVQIDTPISSPLTEQQKKELLMVHAENEEEQPAWFRILPTFAQNYLKEILPKDIDGDWSRCERWRPTTLRHIPGEANTWLHEQIIRDARGNPISYTRSRRQGVPTSNLMPLKDGEGRPLTDQQTSATQNVAQMLDNELPTAQQNFLAAWELPPAEAGALQCPVLLGGLVTRRAQSTYFYSFIERTVNTKEDNNERMYQHKRAAIDAYRPRAEEQGCVLFDLNVGFNASHYKDFDYSSVADHRAFIKYIRGFVADVRNFIANAARDNLANLANPAIETKLQRLELLVQQMEDVAKSDANIEGRNRALHMAALYDLTTRLLAGVSTGNCKSSKDRKGTEILQTDAMEIYYTLYGGDYPYDASPIQRAIFVDIFCHLYLAGQQLKTANFNSPGSEGIKGGTIFDEDVKARLKELNAYRQINEIGDFNKPGTMWHKYWPKYRQQIKVIPLAAGLGLGLMYWLGAAFNIQYSLVTALYFAPLCVGLPLVILAAALFSRSGKISKHIKLIGAVAVLLGSAYLLGAYAGPTASLLVAFYSALPFVGVPLLLLGIVLIRWLKEWHNVRTLTFANPKTKHTRIFGRG
jgi:hypothetical protein